MLGLYERLLFVRVTITCGVSWSEGRRCSCFRSSPSDRRSFVLYSDPWWIIRSPPPLHLFVILVHSASLSLRWHDCSRPKVAPQPGWTGIAAQNAFLTLLTPTSLASRSLLDGSCRLLGVRLCRRLHVHFHINTSPLLQGAWYLACESLPCSFSLCDQHFSPKTALPNQLCASQRPETTQADNVILCGVKTLASIYQPVWERNVCATCVWIGIGQEHSTSTEQ